MNTIFVQTCVQSIAFKLYVYQLCVLLVYLMSFQCYMYSMHTYKYVKLFSLQNILKK